MTLDELMEMVADYIEEDVDITKYVSIGYSAQCGLEIDIDGSWLESNLLIMCEDMTEDQDLLEEAIDNVVADIYNSL